MKKKGQMTIIGLVMIVVSLVTLGAVMPIIIQSIADAQACATGSADTLLDFLPTMMVLGIFISIVVYVGSGSRQQQY